MKAPRDDPAEDDLKAQARDYPEALLDSSAWIGLFKGEPRAEPLREISDLGIVITPVVIAEVLANHRIGRFHHSDPLAFMERGRMEQLTREDAIHGAELYARLRRDGNSKVSLADTLIYATARRIGAALITTDGDLRGEPGVLTLAKVAKPK
ncbi:MAG: PIN domain-containing protein [Thermoplasmatota archaeon]